MNRHLQYISDKIKQAHSLTAAQKKFIIKTLKDADKNAAILEAQKRELEIEAALERVRARAMAMHKSDELNDVAALLFKQISDLGIKAWTTGFNVWSDDNNFYTDYITNPQGGFMEPYVVDASKIPVSIELSKAKKRGDEFYINYEEGEALAETYRNLVKFGPKQFKSILESGFDFPSSQYEHFVFGAKVSLMFITYEPVPEAHDIFKRFGKVFEQAYTRFLDLQKAEAQAREAQIETSLERIRAQAMAMHKSEELLTVCEIMYRELKALGFDDIRNAMIHTFNKKNDFFLDYDFAGSAGGKISQIPTKGFPIVEYYLKEIKKDIDTFLEIVLTGKELESWKNIRKATGQLEDPRIESLEALYYYYYSIGPGDIGISTFSPISKEKMHVLERFKNVFQLSYQRYHDIENAEAQAREAQIEASLERVRAKAMAMHKSDDLHAAIAVVFEELDKLNLGVLRVGISVLNKEKRTGDVWLTSTDEGKAVQVSGDESFDIHPLLHGAFEAWLRQEDFYYLLEGDDLTEYYKAVKTAQFQLPESQILSSETGFRRQYCFVPVYHSGGLFAFRDTEFPDEAKKVMRRFATVFDLTYKRFLDLQKAEAQAREAQIEAALERVRSRTLAMQKSDELAETASVLFKQLITLGIEPNRLYITIINEAKDEADFWITDEDGSKLTAAYTANLNDNSTFKKMYDGWKQQLPHLIIDMHGKELQNYFRYLRDIHVPFKGGLEQKRRVQHLAYFSRGFIGLASPDEQPAETINILERFAYVFNLTFTRFSDLKIAEAHALQAEQDLIEIKSARKKAEEALEELLATQKQLIQSEKMASLGELTAGIAHEIQNPLNFVNNFSEINKELIEELNAERLKPNADRDEQLENEIINDIRDNSEKINFHGKRADGIVKGMLQHSRSGTGQKELTDINALADEYLRLAFHGLRAKDKSFNAEMKTDFDSLLPKINVVPQEIGRVILNLVNNAFYAASLPIEIETKGGLSDSDSGKIPTVWVRTKKENSKVLISVRDNGPGIPKEIIDKIFQPFFTTKPTGQGTGLGLSLAYDIVKAHGGELKVETKEKEGSVFIIQLPVS